MNIDKRYLAFFAVLLAVVLMAGCTGTAPASSSASTQGTTPVSTAAPLSTQVTAAASTPSLVGVWTGTTTGHTQTEGFRQDNNAVYNITVQKGSAFTGYKEYVRVNGISYHENFSGVIARDGKVYLGDSVGGITIGDFVGPDEIEFKNVEDGADSKALLVDLTRKKI